MSRHDEANFTATCWLTPYECVTQIVENTYLKSQFSSWANHDGLNASLAEQIFLTEILSDREAEGERLS